MSSIYFGGSRNLESSLILAQVVQAVISSNRSVHVGCQFGADLQVAASVCAISPSSLFVFAVAPTLAQSPEHVQISAQFGASITLAAGGQSAPIKARYLLRSIAAFQGCECAVFFQPGAGSLAVARECVKSGLPVFAFSEQAPALIPSCRGQWCIAWFMGFQCWGWGKLPEPQEKQAQLF